MLLLEYLPEQMRAFSRKKVMIPSSHIRMVEAEEHEMEGPCLQSLPLSNADPTAYVMKQWWHQPEAFAVGEWRPMDIVQTVRASTPPQLED